MYDTFPYILKFYITFILKDVIHPLSLLNHHHWYFTICRSKVMLIDLEAQLQLCQILSNPTPVNQESTFLSVFRVPFNSCVAAF